MKINPNNIANLLIDLGIKPEDQGKYLNAAAARVIAYRLPLPAEAVLGESSDYFKTELEDRVVVALDAIVERMPIDVDAVIALTYQIWSIRYSLVHCPVGQTGWCLLDTCVKQSRISPEVDFTDDALKQLSSALSDNGDD
jgi:hypothetical protein